MFAADVAGRIGVSGVRSRRTDRLHRGRRAGDGIGNPAASHSASAEPQPTQAVESPTSAAAVSAGIGHRRGALADDLDVDARVDGDGTFGRGGRSAGADDVAGGEAGDEGPTGDPVVRPRRC